MKSIGRIPTNPFLYKRKVFVCPKGKSIISINRRGSQGWGEPRFSAPAARKGIALATQTVVLLVLAAIILGSILIFFTNTFNPQEKGFTSISKQTTLCQQYIRYDPKCEDDQKVYDVLVGERGWNELIGSLVKACKDVGFTAVCTMTKYTDNADACIQKCCANFCG